ncbi:transcription factor EAT1-like [Typha latifolia]|uniref:transcription factor EAT1-like n=1 Tax=Typha latifolia TaxID=4733 RepID=UPI003C2F273C
MYHNHQSDFFPSHESIIPIQGDHLGGPSQTTAAASAIALELDFHRQFDLDANHCFVDPSALSVANLHYPHVDVFFGDGPPPPPDSESNMESTVFYDASSSVQFDLPGQTCLLRDVYNSMPNVDLGEIPQVTFKRQKKASVFREVGDGKEKQRRERLTEKFEELKSLIPNRTKDDRATIISDTIDYIKELGRRVGELKLLVERKRRGKERSDDVVGDMESSSMKPSVDDSGGEQALKGSLRSSWLQRKSKETYVDVRIVEDEVTIKLTQRKKMSCLPILSKVLDELQLELLHLSGGIIGDCNIYMFNTKIHEGSSVYASAVAKKLIEAMNVHCPSHLLCS